MFDSFLRWFGFLENLDGYLHWRTWIAEHTANAGRSLSKYLPKLFRKLLLHISREGVVDKGNISLPAFTRRVPFNCELFFRRNGLLFVAHCPSFRTIVPSFCIVHSSAFRPSSAMRCQKMRSASKSALSSRRFRFSIRSIACFATA